MLRRLFTILSALSFLLCFVTALLWIWIYYVDPQWTFTAFDLRFESVPSAFIINWETPPRADAASTENADASVTPDSDSPISYTHSDSFWQPICPGLRRWVSHNTTRFQSGRQTTYRCVSVAVSLWLIFVLTSTLPLTYATLSLRRHFRCRYRLKHNLCPCCGYDLRASKGQCPECGSPIPTNNK